MVDVNIDIENACMALEQLEDGEYDVIDIAEPTSFSLLGVVQAAGPIDSDVAQAVVEAGGALERSAGVDAAELVQVVEEWAVLTEIEPLDLLHHAHLGGMIRGHLLKKVNEVIGVKLRHSIAGIYIEMIAVIQKLATIRA